MSIFRLSFSLPFNYCLNRSQLFKNYWCAKMHFWVHKNFFKTIIHFGSLFFIFPHWYFHSGYWHQAKCEYTQIILLKVFSPSKTLKKIIQNFTLRKKQRSSFLKKYTSDDIFTWKVRCIKIGLFYVSYFSLFQCSK